MSKSLLQLQSGSKSYSMKNLFHQATFAINEGEKIGVIGPNGAGKSTLFKILLDKENLDEGTVVKSQGLHLSYLAQEDHWPEETTLESYLEGLYRPIWDVKAYAKELDIPEDFFEKPIKAMSGGYRMRAKLLRLYAESPNLMLLDEPTNYLDIETLLLLEKFILDYPGAMLLISHDREFLKRTTDHTLEVEAGEITKYSGSIEDYFEQKALLREHLEKQQLAQSAVRKEILNFVNRFGAKATKARQAQSRLKRLDKMQKIEVKPLPIRAQIKLPEPHRVGKMALEIENVQLGYGEVKVLEDVNLEIAGGQKMAIVGHNGAGKSTLLKGIQGILPTQAGNIQFGYEMNTAYYGQHVAEELDLNCSVLQELEESAGTHVRTQEVLDLAGGLLFSGDDVHKPIRVLSGGEKARVSLGKILLSKAPILLLDEPTNHLDFYTVEALAQALGRYKGTILFVSHDRSFVQQVATQIVEIDGGKATKYPGTYEEYIWSLEKGALKNRSLESEYDQEEPKKNKSADISGEAKGNLKRLKKVQRDIEKQMNGVERKINDLNNDLLRLNDEMIKKNDPELFKQAHLTGEMIKELEIQWMQLSEKFESYE
ncbi:MAG: ABC-F family ATP-binding cassette domain-containing protein [Bdellovibrionales bacterium]|nr:ABC-F family ATP-binding cassette domain-containing protein [Bdellovibrionales bacterium]